MRNTPVLKRIDGKLFLTLHVLLLNNAVIVLDFSVCHTVLSTADA